MVILFIMFFLGTCRIGIGIEYCELKKYFEGMCVKVINGYFVYFLLLLLLLFGDIFIIKYLDVGFYLE